MEHIELLKDTKKKISIEHLMKEFFRYLLVGGSAFIIDISLLYVGKNYVFNDFSETGIYLSTALGFLGGLIYNYILCLVFVFHSAKTENKGKTIGSFLAFALIGLAGLLLTECGMYVGVEMVAANYLLVKAVVAMLVLVWNYGIRKVLIFR